MRYEDLKLIDVGALALIFLCTIGFVCSQTGNMFVISDIHYDPYFDSSVGPSDFCRNGPPSLHSKSCNNHRKY